MSAPWTPEEHAAARARCEVATAGPWRQCGADRGGCPCGQIWTEPLDMRVMSLPTFDTDGPNIPRERQMLDTAFVAHARTDLPRALDHIQAQAAEIERLKVALDEADDAFVAIQAVEYSAAFVPEQYEVNVDQIASAAVGRIRAIRGGA